MSASPARKRSSFAIRMPLVLSMTTGRPLSKAIRSMGRMSGWIDGSPPLNWTTSGSPSSSMKRSSILSTCSIERLKPGCASAKQIGQSRLQWLLTSIRPRHVCCLCSVHSPQSFGQPSTTSVL